MSHELWTRAQELEAGYWSNANVYIDELEKQKTYAHLMNLPTGGVEAACAFEGKRILDVGGGPISMTLMYPTIRERVVVDPMPIPEWAHRMVSSRKLQIQWKVEQAEVFLESLVKNPNQYDEVWMYNCAQHVEVAQDVISGLSYAAPVVRVFEWLYMPEDPMHLHMLDSDMFGEYADKRFWKRHAWTHGHLDSERCVGGFLAFHVEKRTFKDDER